VDKLYGLTEEEIKIVEGEIMTTYANGGGTPPGYIFAPSHLIYDL